MKFAALQIPVIPALLSIFLPCFSLLFFSLFCFFFEKNNGCSPARKEPNSSFLDTLPNSNGRKPPTLLQQHPPLPSPPSQPMAFSHGDAVLVHGDLDLHIIAARNLPNRGCFSLCVTPSTTTRSPSHSDDEQHYHPHKHQHHHNHHHRGITSDPYVIVCVAETTVACTSVIHNCDEPNWDEHFRIPLAHCASILEFVIKDEDIFGAQIIGTATVSVSFITSGEQFDKWLDVVDPYGQPDDPIPQIHVAFKFTPVDDNPVYKDGITGDCLSRGVEDAYFPMRKGGQVTLYQDAHVRDGELPEIRLDSNRAYVHEKCWEDICHAILEAHHLIYIVGWSIYTEVRLVRESTRPVPLKTLGELLRYKSEEGVRVCLLVWDNKVRKT